MRSGLAIGMLWITLGGPPGIATASDGRREINQACALAGCFPGDDAGFPVTLTSAGSYVLTSNLTVTNTSTAISVSSTVGQAPFEIDLNGFQLLGPYVCTGSGPTLSCTGSQIGTGVHGGVARVTVRNGRVSGFGEYGVDLQGGGRIERVTARHNRIGIRIGEGSITHSLAVQNASTGISLGSNAVLAHSVSAENSTGIVATGLGAVLTLNVIAQNRSDGILGSAGALISGNSVYSNGRNGIDVNAPGGSVVDNASVSNGVNGILGAGGDGFAANRNVARGNLFSGVTGSIGASFRENTITGNGSNNVPGGTNVSLGANFCDGIPC